MKRAAQSAVQTFAVTEKLAVRKYEEKGFVAARIDIVREIPFEIYLNGVHVVTTACAGHHLEEMSLGFLRAEGLIRSYDDIRKITSSRNGKAIRIITRDPDRQPFSTTTKLIGSSGARLQLETAAKRNRGLSRVQGSIITACGPSGLDPKKIISLMEGLLSKAEIHDLTRGTHCSALASAESIIIAREDIGRHNTLDMLGGYALLNGIDCADKVVLTTGRVSSEIVSKVSRMGAPVVISHSAAMTRAIAQAEAIKMTLIGYVRGECFIVYTDRMNRVR
jgi:FdhD protein